MLLQSLCTNEVGSFFASSSTIDLIGFSLMSSLLILSLSYVISRIWGDEKIRLWVRQELWNLVLNGILIMFVIGIIDLFSSNLTSISNIDSFMGGIVLNTVQMSSIGGDCLFDYSYRYTLQLMATSLEQAAINTWASLHFIYISRITTQSCISDSYILCLLSAPTASVNPYLNVDWAARLLSTFNRILLTTVFLFAYSQAVLIKLFITSDFAKFLGIMLILRLLPFTRGFANVVFSLIVGFMVFYPLIVALESYVFGIPSISSYAKAIAVSVEDASALRNVYYGRESDSPSYLSIGSLDDIWDVRIGSSGTDITLVYRNNTDVVNLDKVITGYADLLFRVVLFGSINLILVSLVIRELLRYSGESENLMEMFIRMGGIITW